MKKEIITFEYEGIKIEFGIGEAVWMNATEIAKHHGKLIGNWSRNSSTEEYITALKTRYANSHNGKKQEFLMIYQGGSFQGTWIHQKLALRFAQWLNPDFAVWVDEKIEELLTTGKVELKTEQSLPDLPKNYVEALRRLADSEEARMIAESKAEENQEKADGFELLIEKADNYTLQEAADLLGTGRTRFSNWLKSTGHLQDDRIPYQASIRNGWFVIKERIRNGIVFHAPMITPKGMEYFTRIRNKGGMNHFLNKSSLPIDLSKLS